MVAVEAVAACSSDVFSTGIMMKSFLKTLALALVLGSAGLMAETLEQLKADLDQAQGVDAVAQARLNLAKHYEAQGDLPRAMNQLEFINAKSADIESNTLILEIEAAYWRVFKAFNRRNPKQDQYDEKQKLAEEEAARKDAAAKAALATGSNELKKVFELRSQAWDDSARDRFRTAWSKGRPKLRRKLSPLSMGHLNGLNAIVGIPELESAYLLPMQSRYALDYKFDFGKYDEQSVNGRQELQINSTITRGLVEWTVPYGTLLRSKVNRPIDFKLGIPVVRWNNTPYFTFDNLDRTGNKLLLKGETGSFSLGDIYLEAKSAYIETESSALSAKFRLKLPTGSTKDLAGSGSMDYALALLYSRFFKPGHSLNVNLGYMLTGSADNFERGSVDMSDVMFFGADFAFSPFEFHYFIFSVDYHQNVFEGYTEIPVLEDPPLSTGLGYAFQRRRTRFHAGMKLGLNGASADQTLLISVKHLH